MIIFFAGFIAGMIFGVVGFLCCMLLVSASKNGRNDDDMQ